MPAAKAAPAKPAAAAIDPARRRLSTGVSPASSKAAPPKAAEAAGGEQQLLLALRGTISSHIGATGSTSKGDGKPAVVLRSVTDAIMGKKRPFEEKDFVAEGSDAPALRSSLVSAGIGITCRKGMKPECPNQDCYTVVIQDEQFKLFAVFDGHGPKGHDVAVFAAENLVKLFLRHEERDAAPEQALREAFIDTQAILDDLTRTSKISAGDSGTTGTLAYLPAGTGLMYLAHVGDSRAVMCRQGTTDQTCVGTDLTVDHKPDLKEERERIEKAGGMVVFDGYFNYRVYSPNGRGGLNMSRSLGDGMAQKAGVTAVPECSRVALDVAKVEFEPGKDLFIMLCSDGVWEFIQSQAACDMVFKHGRQECQKAVEDLAKASYELWMDDSEGEISDDITVVLAWL